MSAIGGRQERLMAEAEAMAKSFEKGEPFYASPVHYEPTPDETKDDAYWRGLAEIIQRAVPELAKLAFEGKGAGLYGPARAHFLLALWKEIHSKLHALPDQTHEVKLVPLPTVAATSNEWQQNLSSNQALSLSPRTDPNQPSSPVPSKMSSTAEPEEEEKLGA